MRLLLSLCLLIMIIMPCASQAQKTSDDYVVLLHGIARSSSHMEPLAEFLQNNGYDVINIDYPSTDYTIEELVEIIHKDLSTKLTEDKKINFIGYSMGGLLTLAILHKYKPEKLGRVIQLAPPNHGSEVADFLKENWLYKKFFGKAGQHLTTNKPQTKEMLGKIDYELGIIAGDSTIDPISSYIIDGNDDGKVSIQSTKLEDMKDHIIVSASHTLFPSNEDVHMQVLHFLQHGEFKH